MIVYLVAYLTCIIFVQIFALATYDAKADEELGITGSGYFYLCLFSPITVLIIILIYLMTIK